MTDDSFDVLLTNTTRTAKTDLDVARRLSRWTMDCAAHVLPLFERAYPGDDRPRRALVAVRAFARGEIDWESTRDAAWAATAAAEIAAEAEAEAATWAAVAAWAAAIGAVAEAAAKAAADAAADAAAERLWQHERLVARMSDPEPEDWPLDVEQEDAS